VNAFTATTSSSRIVVTLALAAVATLLGSAQNAAAQGCLLTRNMAPVLGAQLSPYLQPGEWQIGTNYRQFTADHQYQGTDLSAGVTRLGTQVISKMQYMDLNATYAVTTQWSVTAAAPIILRGSSNRALPATVAGSPRFSHSTSGLGDIMVGGRYWFMDCDSNPTQNFALGIALKMPTGKSDATDMFPNALGLDVRERVVDQSIQLGDSGWGFGASAEAFKQFGYVATFASGVYIFNPKGQNDTLSPPALLNPVGPEAVAAVQRFNTVSDSYLARAGVGVAVPKLTGLSATFAARIEGVPVNDLLGDTTGFRRPGNYVTIEPGAVFAYGRTTLFLSVPLRVYQNVKPSLGFVRDSTFADHVVLAGTTIRVGGF
jgi:hypothetical protein